MESSNYYKWLGALWLSLPTTALSWWVCWARLPARLPTKYDAAGVPLHWASPYQGMLLSLELLGFVLVVMTVIGYLVAYQRPERATPVLVAFHVSVGLLWLLLNWFIWSQRI